MGREEQSNRVCLVGDVRMTMPERDLRMKLDYINGGITLAGIAEKYNLSRDRVGVISRRDKWVSERKAQLKKLEECTKKKNLEVFVDTVVDVNLQFHNTWQKVVDLCNNMLNNPETYLIRKDGNFKMGTLQVLIEALEKAHNGQNFTSGIMSKKDVLKYKLDLENLQLKKQQLGEGEGNIIEDNFMDILKSIGSKLDEVDGGEVLYDND